jgi:Domain of unknown function (DUF1841)
MFAPTQDDVRRFFCEVYRKHQATLLLTPLESLAMDWVVQHPEYHADLADLEAALAAVFVVEEGRTNPFLHLAMHLTALSHRLGSMHAAQHVVMEYLGEMVWESQRSGLPPDGQKYIDAVRRHASKVVR